MVTQEQYKAAKKMLSEIFTRDPIEVARELAKSLEVEGMRWEGGRPSGLLFAAQTTIIDLILKIEKLQEEIQTKEQS